MSMNYGSRRDRPHVRLLNEETEAEKYRRLGWDPRKTYEENMGYEGVFDRPDEELDWPDVAPQRRKPTRQVRELAAEGRGNDTEIAHVARGEFVIPQEFQTPEVLAALRHVAAARGVPLERLIIGNAQNRINPYTGAPEFWFDSDQDADWPYGPSITQKPEYILYGEPEESPMVDAGLASGLPDSNIDQTYLPAIKVPGTESYEPPSPGVGTMPMPTEPSPGYKPPSDPGMGTAPLPTNPDPDRGLPAPGFGSFTYGPNNQTIELPGQAEAWPSSSQVVTERYNWPRKDKNGAIWKPDGTPTHPHGGIDLQNKINNSAYATTSGTIDKIGTDKGGNNYITWRDNRGNLFTYVHTSPAKGMTPGTAFAAGSVLGVSDGSGGVAPHLHMEVQRGTPQFPATYRTPNSNPESFLQRFPYRVKDPSWPRR